MAEFTCRRLTKEEIPACARIVFRAFNKYSMEKKEPMIPEPGIVEERLREYEADTGIPGLLYGGFLDEKQVAFMMIRKLGIDDEALEISMLAVDPDYQKQGIGRKMVKAGCEEILTLKGVLAVCAVTENNDVALKLFAEQGFESEASGIPVSETMSIWMLRKDMRNQMAAEAIRAEMENEKKQDEGLEEYTITM